MRQNIDIPVDLDVTNFTSQDLPLQSRLAFIQVGVWEVRRRWLAGEIADLDRLLACLDEDVSQLYKALEQSTEEEAIASRP